MTSNQRETKGVFIFAQGGLSVPDAIRVAYYVNKYGVTATTGVTMRLLGLPHSLSVDRLLEETGGSLEAPDIHLPPHHCGAGRAGMSASEVRDIGTEPKTSRREQPPAEPLKLSPDLTQPLQPFLFPIGHPDQF